MDGETDRLPLSSPAITPLARSGTLAGGLTGTTEPLVSLGTGSVDLTCMLLLARIREPMAEALSEIEEEEEEDEDFLILATSPMEIPMELVGASRVTPVSMGRRFLSTMIRMNAAS